MDVLLLRTYASAGMCLPTRYLAMGLYVTVDSQSSTVNYACWNSKKNSLGIAIWGFDSRSWRVENVIVDIA
jgi:hypothetical protein